MITWDYRTACTDANQLTAEYEKASKLYFRRFRDYPDHKPEIITDRTGTTLRFSLPGEPPPEPLPHPVTGTQISMTL